MKLSLRSFESKQTLKMDVPNSCTLSQLKQTLAQFLPHSPFTDSIRLSLNRKDQLQSDGGDSLHSLGIADGGLIYFSIEQPSAPVTPNSQNALPKAQNPDFAINGEISARVSQMEETVEEEMEVDGEDNTDVVGRSSSVPGLLRKVFMEESGVDDAGKDHKLIAIAVHWVMLESGFVSFDKNTNTVISNFQFGNEWPSPLFRLPLFYTLKESTNNGTVVVLKFQSLGKFINVFGTLENGSGNSNMYHVQLNKDQLIPFLNVNCGLIESTGEENGGLLGTSPQKEVFEFCRSVKDNLVLPLLIDICEEFGLELPPCFMRLPSDLKLRILESLTGIEIAKASCVCSELRYLGSSEDLWKVKFGEEFEDMGKPVSQKSWKKAYVSAWDLMCSGRVLRMLLKQSRRGIRLLI